MGVRVLGPLDTEGETLSPRERSVLSALIVRAGSSMRPAELADAYWGESVPTTWAQQVKTSVARIRSRVGAQAVLTDAGGYAFGLDPDSVDAFRFERLVSTARMHALQGEYERALDSYRRALALWRGPAYPDVAAWPPGAAEAARLEEIRRSAEEEALESRLALGEHRGVIADAERLVRDDPLRESRWAVLALANYRSDRQAEALAVIRSARERLVDELGIEPGHRLSDLESAMLRQDPALVPETVAAPPSSDCPYRGLTAFGVDDAEEFFGREHEVDRILERVQPGSFLALAGASGCGKSSLALAGVVPHLRERGRSVTILRPIDGERTADAAPTSVAVIDQFEELFALDEDRIARIVSAVAGLIERGGSIVVTVRSDFLDRCLARADLAALCSGNVEAVLPMQREQLRSAIEDPARLAGLRIEHGLTELILRDAADAPAALPAMSHALVETWLRREGRVLTVDGYEAAGGIAGGIANSAEQLYRALSSEEQSICRALMIRLIDRGPDGTSIRRSVELRPLQGDSARARVIAKLAQARLIAIEGQTLAIAHEAVASAWPRLDAWLNEDAAGTRIIGALSNAASSWTAGGELDEDLYRGARLQTALEWRDTHAPDLTLEETRFLEASAARARTELDEREARVARDQRQNRRLRVALVAAAALAVLSLVAGSVAVVQSNQATASAENSLIDAVTSRSVSLLENDREVAALMAVEAYRRWPSDARTRSALLSSMTAAGPFLGSTYIADTDYRIGAWPIHGTNDVAVMRDKTNLDVYDINSGELKRSVSDDFTESRQEFRPWVRVSADGSTIAVMQHVDEPDPKETAVDPEFDRDELVYFFDVESGTRVGEPLLAADFAESFALSDDGRFAVWASSGWLVVADRDTQTVRRLDLIRGERAGAGDVVYAAADIAPSGLVVVTTIEKEVVLVDPHGLLEVRRFGVSDVGEEVGWMVTEVSDDGILVTSFKSESILAIEVATGTVLWQKDHARSLDCSRLAVSTVQRLVICGSEQGVISMRDLDTGTAIGDPWLTQLGGGGDMAFSDDESVLYLLSAISPSIGRLAIDGGGPAATAVGGRDMFSATGFDPSGRYLALADLSTAVANGYFASEYVIWDVQNQRKLMDISKKLFGPDDDLGDIRWAAPGILAVSMLDLATTTPRWELVDVASGEVRASPFPANTWWVYPNRTGEIVYATLEDLRDTEEVEDFGVIAFDTRSWKQLDVRFDVRGTVESLSTTSDGSLVLMTVAEGGENPWRSYLFTPDGQLVREGLPRQWGSVMTGNGEVIAADSSNLSRFSADFEPLGSLPAISAWQLSTSDDDRLLIAHGSGRRGLAVVDLASERQLGDALATGPMGTSQVSGDGETMITSGEHAAQLWTLDPNDHAKAACRIAGRELTADEWDTYLADLGPQRPICADVLG